MAQENIVYDKSLDFAVRAVKLSRYLIENFREYEMSSQIKRSATSIGANISEALCAASRKDFLAKLYIAFKESNETEFWLKLLYRCEHLTPVMFNSMMDDLTELKRLLSSITKTVRESIE